MITNQLYRVCGAWKIAVARRGLKLSGSFRPEAVTTLMRWWRGGEL